MNVPARPTGLRLHRDLARAITAVENGQTELEAARSWLAQALGAGSGEGASSFVVGITGPPGAGKSTLIDCLIEHTRAGGQTVAVIAIDPSSPFSQGAVLGDRVRMQRHSGDPGVFVRSMASRQAGGGLAPATRDAITLAEQAGFELIIIETVGVGQVELDVVSVADAVVVVTVPALGDEVQAIKAGLTEIADIFVVNMSDRPGANRTAAELKQMTRESGRQVAVLQTVASEQRGVAELAQALAGMRGRAPADPTRRLRLELIRNLRDTATRRALSALASGLGQEILKAVANRSMSRAQAVEKLLALASGSTPNAN